MSKMRALPHFADPKFLKMLLLEAFRQYCQGWPQYDRKEKNWTDAEIKQVEDVLIASVTKLYGTCDKGATVTDAIKLPKQAFIELGPGLDRAIEMFERFLELNGCWLKGELPNREFYRLFRSWENMKRGQRAHLRSAERGRWAVGHLLKDRGLKATIQEAMELNRKATLLELGGVGVKSVEALDLFRTDCGYKPLK